MKKAGLQIKKLFQYLLRDELDIRRKLINIILFACAIIQIPTMIFSACVGATEGLPVQSIFLFVAAIGLFDVNRNPKSMRPLVFVTVSTTSVLMPILFFLYGGHRTGMLIWIAFGGLLVWILLDGIACYIICALNLITVIVANIIEFTHPELVMFMESEKDEMTDQLIALVILVLLFGFMFKYQRNMYEKQHSVLIQRNLDLEEKEKELAKTNLELESASLAKSDFLASMSHEIRTPINAMLGMNEMILRESENEEILKYASDIDSAGHQLLAIINDILDFTKIESGKMEIHPAEYELYSIANDCFNMINMRARKKDLEFSIENDPTLPSYLVGDEIRVRQIIVNLLTNAVKYTKDGWVKMRLYKKDIDEENILLCIEVKDTGIGISDENIEKLFMSFERFDEIRNRHIEGTGLGLTITKKFIDLMGGTINVTSTLDVGSVFTVEIPQKIASHTPMGDFADRFEKKSGAKHVKAGTFTAPSARIMVVDDVKMNLNVVRLLLKNTKIQVDMAQSGAECLSMSMLKTYDVILMDHMMPEMDGIETLREMRKMKRGLNARTPVVALTANAIAGADDMYRKEGFEDYISKPIKGEALEKILIKYIPNEKVVFENNEENHEQ